MWFQGPENNTQTGLLTSSTSPSPLRRWLVSLTPQLGLVVLLLAEILYLTTTFDTEILQNVPSGWAQLLGWTPQMLRLAVAIAGTTLLFTGSQLWPVLRSGDGILRRPSSPYYLGAHLFTFVGFLWITAMVMSGRFSSLSHPGFWSLAWFLAGATTLISWGLSLFSYETWLNSARQGRIGILCGIIAGSIAWAGSFLTAELWRPFASYTFAVVRWVLGFIYSRTVSDSAKLLIGTPKFRVIISPECSGYEGIGLVVAFLTVFVWLSRRKLRFPGVMWLFPLGAATMWTVNIFRIAALVVIGTSGWPTIARGGFHSEAGWIGFSGVALGLVALTTRRGYFMLPAQSEPAVNAEADPTAAYLTPFLVIILSGMFTGALSATFDNLYPLRIISVGIALWVFRKAYAGIKWNWSWQAILIGAVTFIIWLAMMPAAVHDKDGWPSALRAMPLIWSAIWLLVRIVGYVVAAPIAEELAFRGFLTRRLIRADFHHLPMGAFSWASFAASSILFGALHGSFWLAGSIAGLLFALALYRRRMLADAVQAHATTNALIAVYVLITGRWSVWS